jgi:hypothetical protein
MAKAKIYRDLTVGKDPVTVETDVPKGMRGAFLFQSDKSDPLNQLVVAGIVINEKLSLKVTVEREGKASAESRAIAILAAAIIDNAAEIRDALAAE